MVSLMKRLSQIGKGAWAAVYLAALGMMAMPAAAQTQGRQYRSEDIRAGAKLYGAQCALCHGQNGDGIAGVNLPRQQFRRASSDEDIRNTIGTGVAAAGMPAFRLMAPELDGLIAYIRSGFDQTGTGFTLGNAARGQALFEGKGGCLSCHRVHGKGALAAPDLSDIGLAKPPGAIQRSLLEPSSAMQPINRTVRIVLGNGRTIEGRRVNEDTHTVQLIGSDGALHSLEKSAIRRMETAARSDMPSYADTLSGEERADLLAYLVSLKGL